MIIIYKPLFNTGCPAAVYDVLVYVYWFLTRFRNLLIIIYRPTICIVLKSGIRNLSVWFIKILYKLNYPFSESTYIYMKDFQVYIV